MLLRSHISVLVKGRMIIVAFVAPSAKCVPDNMSNGRSKMSKSVQTWYYISSALSADQCENNMRNEKLWSCVPMRQSNGNGSYNLIVYHNKIRVANRAISSSYFPVHKWRNYSAAFKYFGH